MQSWRRSASDLTRRGDSAGDDVSVHAEDLILASVDDHICEPAEMFNVHPMRYEEMRPGCYDVHERVRDMSAGGQLAGLNFPNWTGFSGQVLNEGPDPDVN